jgi:hypothetical protein
MGGAGTRGGKGRACSDGIGVGTGLEQTQGILALAELDLRDERGLARKEVLALERRRVHTRHETALLAVFARERKRCGGAHPPKPVFHDNAPHAVGVPTLPDGAVLQKQPAPREPPPLRCVEVEVVVI